MSTRAESLPKPLVVGVLLMTLLVLALGGAVLAVRLRPDSTPPTTAERTLQGWQQLVEQDPKSDTAHTGYGLALLEMGRVGEAKTEFQEALRLNEDNWMASFQLGLLMRESDPAQAVALLENSAKSAAPGDKAVPFIALGDFLLARGDAEGARDAYRSSIADTSYLFDSHYGLAQALEELGETKAALNEYRAARRFAPDHEGIAAAIDRLSGE